MFPLAKTILKGPAARRMPRRALQAGVCASRASRRPIRPSSDGWRNSGATGSRRTRAAGSKRTIATLRRRRRAAVDLRRRRYLAHSAAAAIVWPGRRRRDRTSLEGARNERVPAAAATAKSGNGENGAGASIVRRWQGGDRSELKTDGQNRANAAMAIVAARCARSKSACCGRTRPASRAIGSATASPTSTT